MTVESLSRYVPQDRKSTADVRFVVRYMMERFDNLNERERFSRHGVNAKDLRDNFPKVKGYSLGTYRNRCRDNVYLGYFGVHMVDGLKHWFPKDLAETVDHSRCVNCTTK